MQKNPGKEEDREPKKLGHFDVLDKIGQGGMAVVYQGIQPSLNRRVAIKVLPKHFANSEELVARFNREAQIAAQLNHPNIVQIIDRGKSKGMLYIVMEYVDGEDLGVLIEKGVLTLGKIVSYSNQICDALAYAHEKGVIHRDLKPANILIDKSGDRAKISDFGIAQISLPGLEHSTLTSEHAALGTISYMSPEQRTDSHSVTHLTDIFSFGVMLYQMLTSELPIGHFKMPSRLNPHIPLGFDDIIKKCLETNPSDRFQSATELKNAINNITGWQTKYKDIAMKMGDSVRHLTETSTPWISRKFAYILGTAVILLIAAFSFIFQNHMSSSKPETQAVVSGKAVNTPAPVATKKDTQPGVGKEANKQQEAQEKQQIAAELDAKLKSAIQAAQKLVDQGQSEAAIDKLKSIISQYKTHPRAVEAQYKLAGIYYDRQNYPAALEEIKLLERFYPNSSYACSELLLKGNIYKILTETGEDKYEDENYTNAIDSYDTLIKKFPKSPKVARAVVQKCSLQWDKRKKAKRMLLIKQFKQYDRKFQKELISQLKSIPEKYPRSSQVERALRLIAEIAERPKLKDYSEAGDARLALFTRNLDKSADNLYEAADLFVKADNNKGELKALEKFVKTFPEDKRTEQAKKRIKELRANIR